MGPPGCGMRPMTAMNTPPTANGRLKPVTLAWLLLAVLASLWLGYQALKANLQHACREAQWPGFVRCEVASESLTQPEQVQRELTQLRKRVQDNPGDAWAMAEMARLTSLPDELLGQRGAIILEAAALLAPNRTEILEQQMVRALARQDWTQSVPKLVLLATRHGDSEATRTLARLLSLAPQDADLTAALQSALKQDTHWLDKALLAMPAEKLPMAAVMPLVSTAALAGQLKPATGLVVIRQLKLENRWLDAHAIWLQLWKRPLDLLFNGGFEQRFVKHGFDWEVSDESNPRAGVQIERVGRGERGQVLQLRFTGRPLRLPIVHQDLMLPPGTYQLEGDYQSAELRSEAGLVWVLTCADSARELARTAPIGTTGREWRTLGLRLVVPGDCSGAILALQPQTAFEARTGLRGDMLFDRMRLSRVEPGNPESKP